MSIHRFIILAVWTSCSLTFQLSHGDEAAPIFETHVQAILSNKCGKCHSEKVRKGGLNLASITGIRKGGESGESAVAESVDESLLWIMIDGGDMPPEGQPPLTKDEIAAIREWIASGARSRLKPHGNEKQITQHDVLPIVLLRCATCHGSQRKQGGFDVRTPTAMRKGGKSGPGLIAGDPDSSLMIQRIENEACPPRDLLLKFFVKRPPSSEVKTLREWISSGALEFPIQPDIATTEPDPLVTDEDRQHWAFQPPQIGAGQHSIDGFVLEKLTENELTFSPEADRDTLIRRAYLDLVGMPPSHDDWQKWHNYETPEWYSAMIDQLLASPAYGERWGRYWLDVAGYADSEGGVSADPVRKVAWKYRDYVIRAFNEDKPYDRFLLEQLAGDELIDHAKAEEVTDEMVQNLIATGFLRMSIDQTGSRTMNFVPERLGVISDAIAVVSSGVMGLTMGCARCHSHKYDPIPHRDYYRFKAIFQGALDEHDWLTFKNRQMHVDTPDRHRRVASINPPLTVKLKQLEAQLTKAQTNVQLELLRQHYPEQSEADQKETIRALRIADNNRTQPQRVLVEKLQTVEVLAEAQQPKPVQQALMAVKTVQADIATVRRKMEAPIAIRALWDRGEPSPTYVLRRGEHNKPGQLVGPGVPSALTDGSTPLEIRKPFPNGTPKTGRRLAFARWLTNNLNPLTARVLVNRVWHHHFAAGLVSSLENFGVKGERPSHPKLLDWLAVEFMKRGWSIKELQRLVMNSQTYKQSSHITDDRMTRDPLNRLLSRMPLRRMDAETLRDSLLFVSGSLSEKPGGPPDTITVDRDGLVSVDAQPDGRWRRSIYIQYRRTEIASMMATFDYPEMGPNCLSRSVSTVSPQALMLMNNDHIRKLAMAFAQRVQRLADSAEPSDDGSVVDLVYQLALSRSPGDEERDLGRSALRQLNAAWDNKPLAALETYCHTILNSAAFLYID